MKDLKHIVIALVLLLPLLGVAYASYGPHERALVAQDETARDMVNALARAAETQMKASGAFPGTECPSHSWVTTCLVAPGTINWAPPLGTSAMAGLATPVCEGEGGYCFKSSESGDALIIYTDARSMKWREYCNHGPTTILYSSADKRTDIVCTADPQVGEQKFAR